MLLVFTQIYVLELSTLLNLLLVKCLKLTITLTIQAA